MCCADPPPALLLEGIAQFNRGEYFEQHETLEILWREESRPVRRLYQGILQVGVAFHHVRRNNHHGALYMLTRGPMYLAPFAPVCQGVCVDRLIEDAVRARAEIERLGPDRVREFDWRLAPVIVLDDTTPR